MSCPLEVCDGSGWIEVAENTARPCECQAQRARQRYLRRVVTDLPEFYLRHPSRLDRNPVRELPPSVLTPLKRFAKTIEKQVEEGRGLWLTGPVNTKKTSAAIAVGYEGAERGLAVGFHVVPELLTRIRLTYTDATTDDYQSFMDRLLALDVLILDDLVAAKTTEWVMEQFYVVINRRMLDCRGLIVTSDRGPDELRRDFGPEWGPRIVRRLLEICEVVEFDAVAEAQSDLRVAS